MGRELIDLSNIEVLLDVLKGFVSLYHKLRYKNVKNVIICKNCGKEVVRNSKKAKFCSDKCRIQYFNRLRKTKKERKNNG